MVGTVAQTHKVTAEPLAAAKARCTLYFDHIESIAAECAAGLGRTLADTAMRSAVLPTQQTVCLLHRRNRKLGDSRDCRMRVLRWVTVLLGVSVCSGQIRWLLDIALESGLALAGPRNLVGCSAFADGHCFPSQSTGP